MMTNCKQRKQLRRFGIALIVGLAITVVLTFTAFAADKNPEPAAPCQTSDPRGWCAENAADPCSRHKNVEDCKADLQCVGVQYTGESVVACQYDERGFGINCPTVGCQSRSGVLVDRENKKIK